MSRRFSIANVLFTTQQSNASQQDTINESIPEIINPVYHADKFERYI